MNYATQNDFNSIKSTNECQLFIGANEQYPTKDVGEYFLKLANSFFFIRIHKKPNNIKRFFMKYLLGIEFYQTKEHP